MCRSPVFSSANDFQRDVGPYFVFFFWRKSHPAPPLVLSGDAAGVTEAEVMVQHVPGRTLGFFGGGGAGGGGWWVISVPGNRMCGPETEPEMFDTAERERSRERLDKIRLMSHETKWS